MTNFFEIVKSKASNTTVDELGTGLSIISEKNVNDINSRDVDENTPLIYSAMVMMHNSGSLIYNKAKEIFTAIVETYRDLDVNCVNKDKRSVMHYLAVIGDDDCLNQIIRKYSDILNINEIDKNGNTPMHCALIKRNMTLEDGKDYVPSAFNQFIQFDNLDCDIQNNEGDTVLHIACYTTSENTYNLVHVQKLIEKYYKKQRKLTVNLTNGKGYRALDIAFINRHYNIVKYLIQNTNVIVSSPFKDRVESDKNKVEPSTLKYRKITEIIRAYKAKETREEIKKIAAAQKSAKTNKLTRPYSATGTQSEKHGGKKKQTQIRKNNKKRRKTFRKSKKVMSLEF